MSRDSSVAPKGEGTLTLRGVEISFEILGDGRSGAGCPLVLTPGGGGGKGGLRWLAQRLRGGRQCLIWDRPNCGASGLTLGDDLKQPEPDMQARQACSAGHTLSSAVQRDALTLNSRCCLPVPVQADFLHELLHNLGMAPAILLGKSNGARLSMIMVRRCAGHVRCRLKVDAGRGSEERTGC
jgi:pimeloyl-ACP methyl ester carboxylesterase